MVALLAGIDRMLVDVRKGELAELIFDFKCRLLAHVFEGTPECLWRK